MSLLTLIVLLGFLAAAVAPALTSLLGRRVKFVLVLYPAGTFVALWLMVPQIENGNVIVESFSWVPALGVSLSFLLDGISALVGMIVSGIGALIIIYAGGYLRGHAQISRMYALLLFFMASMLGVVFSANLIGLFVFWELTSISSYLLIGFNHERLSSRAGALQALLVTGLGGLAMLAGFILMGMVGGSYEITELISRADVLRAHEFYPAMLLLVLLGAFTKSAQVPFHFWLPNAMEAPTPVSAYLHSATMVKAGVFLLARMMSILGGTDWWHYAVSFAGASTMFLGAFVAFYQSDLKRVLAFTTVSALGTLTLLLGLGTEEAVRAAMLFFLVHALYKGALFMVTGSIDHETGTRLLDRIGGLRRAMPITAVTAIVASLSMAGLPPMLGFLSKELLYEAKVQAPFASFLLISLGVLSNALMVGVAALVAFRPFFGKMKDTPKHPHEAPWSMWLGPATLTLISLVFGLLTAPLLGGLWNAAVISVHPEASPVALKLWHGLNEIVALSAFTVLLGLLLFWMRDRILAVIRPPAFLRALKAEQIYHLMIAGTLSFAKRVTAVFQDGLLRHYVMFVTLVVVMFGFWSLLAAGPIDLAEMSGGLHVHDVIIALVMLGGALMAAYSNSRLVVIGSLGIVGYGISMIFLLYGAPDLAMTQFAVETLSVVLFVLILARLPRIKDIVSNVVRVRDGVIAGLAGILLTVLLVIATAEPLSSRVSPFYSAASYLEAKGRNVVNVILVDFRGVDTLGEITVLAIAAVGVFALLRQGSKEGKP
ncbi:MAG: putative monovalent cation/H+ antiporter subunit A [Bacteroidetes bacterium]|jgi:multicomponent Na+:H+ antiporter subunit A|nr:putative monovalent cation/H+ antiporter subunit A [Bacteroidota bacterium]